MSDYDDNVVAPGDRFSNIAREKCVASYGNSPALDVISGGEGGFRIMDGTRWKPGVLHAMKPNGLYEVDQSDGAGGKPQFHTLLGVREMFAGVCWEPITMAADDLAIRGGLPVKIAASNIDVKSISDANWHLCEAILDGLGDALEQSHLVMMTGETAIMRHQITAFCDTGADDQLIMTWNMTCSGLADESRPANGSTVKPGMAIVGLRDWGYRCNGGTKFTQIIRSIWGDHYRDSDEAMTFVKKLVEPSRSYARTISRLNGWGLDGMLGDPIVRLHGVAHITGGGIWGKLPEVLPEGVGADLFAMQKPAAVLLEAQQLASTTDKPMTDYECHGTFHGGYGAMIICDQDDITQVCRECAADGHEPQYIGKTTESADSEITINSMFLGGDKLSSLHPQ